MLTCFQQTLVLSGHAVQISKVSGPCPLNKGSRVDSIFICCGSQAVVLSYTGLLILKTLQFVTKV